MRDALIDTRPIKERLKDYSRDEILLAGAGVPFSNKRVTTLALPVTDQFQTSSCVVHAMMTQLAYEGIINSDDYSRLATYRKRFNYPGAGSNGVDIYNKFKEGQTPWNISPTPHGATEAYANALQLLRGAKLAQDFKFFSYSDAYAPNKALYEYIPHDVNSGKAIQVFIYATNAEWRREWVEPTDKYVTLNNAVVRHAVVLIPLGDFTDSSGKRWYSVHDSAGFGGRFLRYVSEDFIEKRCYWAAMVVPEGETKPAPAPVKSLPTTACSFGERSVAVQALQGYLIDKGYLGRQYLTGYYGVLTMAAVLHFQLFHHLKMKDSIPELLKLKGEFWGPQSIEVVKSLKD